MQVDFPGIAHYKQQGGEPMLEIDARDTILQKSTQEFTAKKPAKDMKAALVQQRNT